MDTSRLSRRTGRAGGQRSRLLPALVVTVLVGAGTTLAAAAPAQAAGEALKPNELAARTYPGVQLVEVDYAATLSVPDATVDQVALNRLIRKLALEAATGGIGTTEAELRKAAVDEIAKDPFAIFKPTKTLQSVKAELTGFGTGFVINPEGYMVTAAHVVNADPAELKQQFALSGLQSFTKQAIADLGSGYTPEEIEKLGGALQKWFAKYLTVGAISKVVSAQLGVAVAGFQKTTKGKPVDIINVGEPYPGKDVAILKLDGESHVPTLPLGEDADVQQGDTLHVAGYPAASTFYSGLSKDSQLQPTITDGPLTAIKKSTTGSPIFQTQAPASPGNSGGPVLDGKGNVVGILVASAVDDGGTALEGQEFVIPISVVREKLKQNNVTAAPSDTTTAYATALGSYFNKYYSQAMPDLQRVKALYPAHPYVTDYIALTQTAIDQGKDETPRSTWIWVVAGLAGLLVIGGLVAALVLRGRRRRVPTQTMHPGQPAMGQPAMAQFAQAGPYQGAPSQQPYPPQYQDPQQYPQQYPQQQPYPQQYPQQPYPQQAPGQYPPQQQQPYPGQPGQQYPPQQPY